MQKKGELPLHFILMGSLIEHGEKKSEKFPHFQKKNFILAHYKSFS